MTFVRPVPSVVALTLVAALITACHVVRFSPQPTSLLGDRMQQGFPKWAKNRDGVFTSDTSPLDHSLWRQDAQAPFIPHVSIYTGHGVDRKSVSLENLRLLLRIPKTFRARPWTGGYFVSDLEGPQMRFLYRTENSILVVPPMADAVGAISDEAAAFLTGFLKRPSNAIMVLGSFQGVFFINENIALEDGSALSLKAVPAVGPFELQDNVLGTIWEGAPMALPCPDDHGCVGVALESLPQQAIVLYATLHSAAVFAIPLGDAGIILYVGYDFDSSFDDVPPAWARVLEVAKRYFTQMTSSTPKIHSPGFIAYTQRKAEDARRVWAARTQHELQKTPHSHSIAAPHPDKLHAQSHTEAPSAEALSKKLKHLDHPAEAEPLSKKQAAEALSKKLEHEKRAEARHELKKDLQAAAAAREASRLQQRRELKHAEEEAAHREKMKREQEISDREAARKQLKLEEKHLKISEHDIEATHHAQHPPNGHSSSGTNSDHSHTVQAQSTSKKSTGEAFASTSTKHSSRSAHSAKQDDSHVELHELRARFSQLHSDAYHLRELASSHFSRVQSSLEEGDPLAAASWVELFDAAVHKAHEATTASSVLSKKIVMHSQSVVSKRRQAFMVAQAARRIALHQLTNARALLSRGFYDRKMGYPADISMLRAAVHTFSAQFRQAEDDYAQAIVNLSNARAHLVKRKVDLQQSRSLYEDELELLEKSSTIKQQLTAVLK